MKEFLTIFLDKLIDNYFFHETEVKEYNHSFKKFIGIDKVKAILLSRLVQINIICSTNDFYI